MSSATLERSPSAPAHIPHDANGNMTGKTDGTDTWTYVWDEDNRLVRMGKNSVTPVEYEYDTFSRLLRRTEGANALSFEWEGWQLVKEEAGDTGDTTIFTAPNFAAETLERDASSYHVHYDASGNMTEKRVITDSSEVVETRTYNDLNQITENEIDDGGTPVTWTYTHDANGNMTGKTDGTDTWTYVWDEDNRLVEVQLNSVTQVEYEYDSWGRMVARIQSSDATSFEWDGVDVISETAPDATVTRYQLPQMMSLHTFERNGSLYHAHTDDNGAVRVITDEAGDVVGHYDTDAWGSPLPSSVDLPGGFHYRFVGALGVRMDPVTGLLYMRNRWYAPTTGRFISRDPIGFAGGINLYAYTYQNPLNSTDAFGLASPPPYPNYPFLRLMTRQEMWNYVKALRLSKYEVKGVLDAVGRSRIVDLAKKAGLRSKRSIRGGGLYLPKGIKFTNNPFSKNAIIFGLGLGLIALMSSEAAAEDTDACPTSGSSSNSGFKQAVIGLAASLGIGTAIAKASPWVAQRLLAPAAAIGTGWEVGGWYGNQLMETRFAGTMTAGEAWQTLFHDFITAPFYDTQDVLVHR